MAPDGRTYREIYGSSPAFGKPSPKPGLPRQSAFSIPMQASGKLNSYPAQEAKTASLTSYGIPPDDDCVFDTPPQSY